MSRPSPSVILDGKPLTADEALRRQLSEKEVEADAFHEQPGRETPPYGRSYPADFEAVARRLASLRREREKEVRQEAADLVEFPPQYIEAACLEIQKTWSRRERAKRAGIFGRIPGLYAIPEAKVEAYL